MLKTVSTLGILIMALAHISALAQSVVVEPLPASVSSGSSGFVGSYYAFVRATNSVGGLWLTPPSGAQSCTVSDASGFSAPYVSSLMASPKDGSQTWYATNNNNLFFPVTSTASYAIILYVNSLPAPPTNGQPLMLEITWNTN